MGIHVHEATFKKLKGLPSGDFSKIQNIQHAEIALKQQADYMRALEDLAKQYETEHKVWMAARDVFHTPNRLPIIMNIMADESSVVTLLSHLNGPGAVKGDFDKNINKLGIMKLSETAASGLINFLESEPALKERYGKMIKQATFIVVVLSKMKGSSQEKNKFLQHIKTPGVVEATMTLKEMGLLCELSMNDIVEHHKLINKLAAICPSSKTLQKAINNIYSHNALHQLLNAFDEGVIEDKHMMVTLVDTLMNADSSMPKYQNNEDMLEMVSRTLNLHINNIEKTRLIAQASTIKAIVKPLV